MFYFDGKTQQFFKVHDKFATHFPLGIEVEPTPSGEVDRFTVGTMHNSENTSAAAARHLGCEVERSGEYSPVFLVKRSN